MSTPTHAITVAIAIAAFDDWGVRLSEAAFSGLGSALSLEADTASTTQHLGVA
ncbi:MULTISPECIES: hypothetical protein [unclassified Microbacterium]|uniref:hypothetical protein n=1 Tax=unclassified Microbacterium TaxID=2609290 RepID=UPI00301A4310